MQTIVSEFGQITLPQKILDQLNIEPGGVIEFAIENNKIIGTKKEQSNPFNKWRGAGKLPFECASVDEYLARIRE